MSTTKEQHFASDNYAGMCPEALDYMIRANSTHTSAYGEDPWTEEASDLFRELFQTDCEVFFVFNGTAANSLALASVCQPYHSVICHEVAHIETDECGGPQFFSNGSKLLLGHGDNGKITPESAEQIITKRQDIHYPKPEVISITQSTEVGTVYSQEEIIALQRIAKKYNLKMHMDGARFSNAVASLDIHPADITWRSGIDVLCFGGTKNGLAVGDAVIFFNKQLAEDFGYRCKQAGQLASKMKFLSAPWVGLLKDNNWLKNGRQANQMAALLEEELKEIPEIEVLFPREANALFIDMPEELSDKLKLKGWKFYNFIGATAFRFMCSWDMKEESVRQLVSDIKEGLTN